MNTITNIKKIKITENDIAEFVADKAIERSKSQTCLNAYALNVIFKNRNSFTGGKSISELISINKRFKKLYLELCRFQFGKHFYRKLKFQTQIHSFIDVSGTKFGSKSIEHIGDNPHIHAVVIPDKSQADLWSQDDCLDDIRKIFVSDTLVESVKLTKFDNIGGLKRFTGYASKYYVRNACNQKYSDQLYCIYPDITKS